MFKAYLSLITAALCWSFIGPIAKFGFREGLSPEEVAFWRSALGTIFFFIHAFRNKSLTLQKKDIPLFFAFGVFGLAGLEIAILKSVKLGGASLATVLLYSAPIWVSVFSFFIFKERFHIQKVLGLLVTLLGIVGISLAQGSLEFSLPAILWGLLSGFSYSLFFIFGSHFMKVYKSETVLFYTFLICSFAIFPFVHFSEKNLISYSALIFLGIFSTYIPFVLNYRGMMGVGPTVAAVVSCFEPVFTIFVSYLIWNETFSILGYFFSFLVILGVLLVSLKR